METSPLCILCTVSKVWPIHLPFYSNSPTREAELNFYTWCQCPVLCRYKIFTRGRGYLRPLTVNCPSRIRYYCCAWNRMTFAIKTARWACMCNCELQTTISSRWNIDGSHRKLLLFWQNEKTLKKHRSACKFSPQQTPYMPLIAI